MRRKDEMDKEWGMTKAGCEGGKVGTSMASMVDS